MQTEPSGFLNPHPFSHFLPRVSLISLFQKNKTKTGRSMTRTQNQIHRSNNQWCTLISVTLFAITFVAAVSYASNRFSLLSLPSSPWPWRWSSSSSSSLSIRSFNLHHLSPPPPLPLPPPLNPKTALYSMFHVIINLTLS